MVYSEHHSLIPEQRQQFLTVWGEAYPAFTGGTAGVVVFHNEEIQIHRQNKPMVRINLNGRVIFKCNAQQTFRVQEVLVNGDWVSVEEQQPEGSEDLIYLMTLLSPNHLRQALGLGTKDAHFRWVSFIDELRASFKMNGFEEVQTPTLVRCPGTEPFLDCFRTELRIGSQSFEYSLPTSPELHLKKALARGWDQIFEIRSCFRNGEITEVHQPEFIMLEWYRAFSSMDDIKNDIQRLIQSVAPIHMLTGKAWETRTIKDLFMEYLHFDLHPHTSALDLLELSKSLGLNPKDNSDFDDLFFLLFVEKIEPNLKQFEYLFLEKYPPSQAALARITDDGWGDRFEFYIRGIEIANAFNELNNPRVQRERTLEDLQKKKSLGLGEVSIDEDFFKHLMGGMPPACGIALGVDRLFMALNGFTNISDFRIFPYTPQ